LSAFLASSGVWQPHVLSFDKDRATGCLRRGIMEI